MNGMVLLLGPGSSRVHIQFPRWVTSFFSLCFGLRSISNKPPTNVEGKVIALCPSAPFTVSSTLDKKPAPFHTRIRALPSSVFSGPVCSSVQQTEAAVQLSDKRLLPAFAWSWASAPSPPLWLEMLEPLKALVHPYFRPPASLLHSIYIL